MGIDLGTSNSAISVIEDGRVRILPDDQGNSVTPSVVSYTQVPRRKRPQRQVCTLHKVLRRSLPLFISG